MPVPAVVLVPAEPVAMVVPAPVLVVEDQRRPLRAAAIVTGVGTGIFGISAAVLGVLAQSNYQQLSATPVDQRADLSRTQNSLNVGADGAMGVAIAAAAATVIFLVVDGAR